jgi:hypothetical protein
MNTQKGFSTLLGLLLILVIVGGGTYFYIQTRISVHTEANKGDYDNENTIITSTSTKTINKKTDVRAEVKKDISNSQDKIYKDEEYGYEFSYPDYMNIETCTTKNPCLFGKVNTSKVDSNDLKNVNLSMANLFSDDTLVKVRITDTRESAFINNKGNTKNVSFGNVQAIRLDYGLAGGEFVIFEISLKNNQYAYIETDRSFVDGKFDEIFEGEGLERLIQAKDGFTKINTSFKVFK